MRVVVLKAGWMARYAGVAHDDHRPVGGGSYNDTNPGHERFNFAVRNGRVEGFAQVGSSQPGLQLRRVDPSASEAGELQCVLVIWVSPRPEPPGVVVVGWYRNATVCSRLLEPPADGSRGDCGYLAWGRARDATLLPVGTRTWPVPTGSGGMRQSAVRYPFRPDGTPEHIPWLDELLERIAKYDGPNVLKSEQDLLEADAMAGLAAAEEGRLGSSGGFESDAELRKAIEMRAMVVAIAHYRAEGWIVDEDAYKSNPFDLLCTNPLGRKRRVEVKGTRGTGEQVYVTHGEVRSARAHETSLFIVSRIKIDNKNGTPTACGGECRIIFPWRPSEDELEAIGYRHSPAES